MSVRQDISDTILASGRVRRKSAISLAAVYSIIFVLEFLAVAIAAYVADALYQYAEYSRFDAMAPVPAALWLAALVVAVSLAF